MSTQDQELRSVGLKATLPRIKVLEIIRGSEERHLSAEDVFRRLLEQGHDVGLATVYRVLSQLEAAGALGQAWQHGADGRGAEAGVEQLSDAAGHLDVLAAVVPVAGGVARGHEELLLLVIVEKSSGDARAVGDFGDAHVGCLPSGDDRLMPGHLALTLM